jgi:histidine ammonia-lyase
MTAARHAREIVANTAHVLAIEVYTASRALHLRKRQNPEVVFGAGTGKAYRIVREQVGYQAGDAWWGPEIDRVRDLILSKTLDKAYDI